MPYFPGLLAQWWAERMVRTNRPLEEKLAYFWHGHFATSNAKAFRYDLMKLHYEMLRDKGAGSFRDLLTAVSQDPQMLIWLDNRSNTAKHPNENFAREVMELFTMGVGNYTEDDIREMARAFTGWTLDEEGLKGRNETARRDLIEAAKFVDDPSTHDDGEKTFLGESGNFNGYDAIDIILKQDATAQFITWKLYRFFCKYEVSEETNLELAQRLRADDYEIRPLLKTIFLSKDFYSPACFANQIKSPVEVVVSTYRKLGLDTIPGIPQFGVATSALGQELFFPPNVAGWEGGTNWINPATLLDRGNFARNVLFPEEIRGADFDVDTYVIRNQTRGMKNTGHVSGESDEAFDRRMNAIMETARQRRINRGGSRGAAAVSQSPEKATAANTTAEQLMSLMDTNGDGKITMDEAPEQLKTGFAFVDQNGDGGIDVKEAQVMADYANNGQSPKPAAGEIDMSDRKNRYANPAETYNAEMGYGLGVMKAKARVKPVPKIAADIQLVNMVRQAGVGTVEEAVDYFINRFLVVPMASETRDELVTWTREVVGSTELDYEVPRTEKVLRRLVHLIMSSPEYQLG